MKTDILDGSGDSVLRAATVLRSGGLVALPTETVYGLAANAYDPLAVRSIFVAKGRPQDNPLIVHVPDLESLAWAASALSPEEQLLFSMFSPGPLTLIVKKNEMICPEVSTGLETIGLRIPNHHLCQTIMSEAKVPLAAPSANKSGEPSPTNATMVLKSLEGRIDLVIDGGESDFGLESSIILLKDKMVHLLRPGAISAYAVLKVLRDHDYDYRIDEAKANDHPSPGTRYRHYAPKKEVILAEPSSKEFFVSARVAVIGLSEEVPSLVHLARHFYELLVRADESSVDKIIVQMPESLAISDPNYGIVEALRDRMRRASGLF